MMGTLLWRERLAHLPMMPRWVSDSSDEPAVSFGERCDFRGSGTDGLCEHRIGVLYSQDHADGRSVAQGVRVRLSVLLDPEVGSSNRELSDHYTPRFVFETLQLDRAERGPVVLDGPRRIGD